MVRELGDERQPPAQSLDVAPQRRDERSRRIERRSGRNRPAKSPDCNRLRHVFYLPRAQEVQGSTPGAGWRYGCVAGASVAAYWDCSGSGLLWLGVWDESRNWVMVSAA